MCCRGAGLRFDGVLGCVAGELDQCLRVCQHVLLQCRINVLGSAEVYCQCAGSCLRVCHGILPGCWANASGPARKVPGTVEDMWESPV